MAAIEASETLADRELVDRLIRNDRNAWDAVVADMVLPIAQTRKFAEILTKVNEPASAVLGELYLDLRKDDSRKLRDFRFEGPFRGWLFFQVKNAVKTVVRKSRSPFVQNLSDEELDRALEGWCVRDRPAGLRDELEVGEACFVRLWRDNPTHAYVLLLKNRLELPSEDIRTLLGLSSANNVDQINRRAKQRMRQFKKEVCV
jgi:hypothetical protein